MTEPRATSFHGNLSRVGDPESSAPEDPAVIVAAREAERIVGELHRHRADLYRAGPSVPEPRPMEAANAPKVVKR